jgi:IS4 transposase
VWESLPADLAVTTGKACERQQWEQLAQPGEFHVGDRYFGEDYQLLQRLMDKLCQFAVRLRQSAQWQVQQTLPLSPADQKAGVIEDLWVRLGSEGQGPRLRIVRVLGPEEEVTIATNVEPGPMSAELVALCYRHRWEVELFFRWLKYVMGSNHWMAESPRGVAIQIYLTLIGAQLLLLYTGQRPNKRMLEALQFYLMGWASAEEVIGLLQKALPQKKK